MIQLRLFRAADPFQQLDERRLEHGELSIGRDLAAEWVIPDEQCEVSRRHCTIALHGDRAFLRDTSANGVFLGDERRRVARDADHALGAHETLHLGQFMIVIEPAASAANDASPVEDLLRAPVSADTLKVRSEWDVDDEVQPLAYDARSLTDATLLDAFCAGAGLDASSFIGDDPVRVMYRAGAIYKQMVVGLGDLLSERTIVKSDLRMDRTTVGAAGNNPFKWAPTRRVAIDLLRERKDGFLSGPAALKASFEDLKKHALCLMAGSRAAIDVVFSHLAPQQIEEEAKSPSLLRLNKSEAAWRLYHTRHAQLLAETREYGDGAITAAFKQGYERQLSNLDELATQA